MKTETKTASPTTITEVVKKIAEGTISPDDGARLLAQLSGGGKSRQRVIKLNKNGGLYVTDPSMRCYSEGKGKHYQAGVNLPIEAARALFANDDLLAAVKKFLAQE
jgi:hypothetical protein